MKINSDTSQYYRKVSEMNEVKKIERVSEILKKCLKSRLQFNCIVTDRQLSSRKINQIKRLPCTHCIIKDLVSMDKFIKIAIEA